MKEAKDLNSGSHRRQTGQYLISDEEVQQFHDLGYIILHDVLTEAEMNFLDPWFDHFIEGGERDKMGKDFCDMSQPYGTPMENFQLVNAMLPSKYRPELVDNIYQQVTQNIADQLYKSGEVGIDYEQFLAKKPSKEGAKFAMHQDLGYWPKTKNTWTATFSLALSDSGLENGCLQVIPGTNKEAELRKHTPMAHGGNNSDEVNRDDSHTLVIETSKDDEIVYLPVKRGSITIHDERIIHGSGGNSSKEWRKTYVIAFRDVKTIEEERAMGFTHSHNDNVDWDEVLN